MRIDSKSLEFLKKQVINDLKEFLPKGCFKLETGFSVNGKELSWNEKWEYMAAMYGNQICYDSDCNTINLTPRQYAAAKVLYVLGNLTDSEKTTTEAKEAIEDYLHLLSEQEKESFVPLLKSDPKQSEPQVTKSANIQPWSEEDRRDPKPEQSWYIPARYFARQLVRGDSTLLTKRHILVEKVVQSLTNVGIKKRGGKKPFAPGTIKKALAKVSLG